MNVRQEKEKKNCSSRGLGAAATAIGVGVGAALYFLFSNRRVPHDEEATASGWNCDPPSNSDRNNALEKCTICFDIMAPEQNVMVLSCKHEFHQNCILTWLQEKKTCPICRKVV